MSFLIHFLSYWFTIFLMHTHVTEIKLDKRVGIKISEV